jgi:phospholipid transport system transporter-binding protein
VSAAKLEIAGGTVRVSGVLDAFTAPQLLAQSAQHFSSTDAAPLVVDLSGVKESDSAGLALLLEWLRLARQRRRTVRFENLPEQLIALAKISEVEALLVPTG